MPLRRRIANRLATAIRRALGGEAAAGVLLMLAAALALALANSPWEEVYRHALHAELPFTPVAKLKTAHLWINDALMALFFFAVGLEIKRELLDGELSSAARRRLPIVAAIAGMAVPAAVFLVFAGGDPELRAGWAIPAATDIAFAIGVLALLGKRAPPSLRLLLLTIAIVDDMGAVAIIALFYTAQVKLVWLAGTVACLAAMAALARTRPGRSRGAGWAYAVLAIVAWLCTLHSGVHATVAGVAAALFVPLRLDAGGDSLLLRMEHALAPWVGYLILPLFGLANAGAQLAGGWSDLLAPLPLGIAAGLFLGKQAGILGAIWLAVRLRFAVRPAGAGWLHLWGMALLCGIGFTMSLFISALAFPAAPALVEEAKLGVLAGSMLSAILGYGVLRAASSRS